MIPVWAAWKRHKHQEEHIRLMLTAQNKTIPPHNWNNLVLTLWLGFNLHLVQYRGIPGR